MLGNRHLLGNPGRRFAVPGRGSAQEAERSIEVTVLIQPSCYSSGAECGIRVTLPIPPIVPFHSGANAGRLVRLCNPRTLRTWALRANLHRDGNAIPLCGHRIFSPVSGTPSLAPTSRAGSPI